MKEICGDVRLTRLEKLKYLYLNIPKGFCGYFSLLKSTHRSPKILLTEITTESPTRHLLDKVFSEVLKKSVLKSHIDVFDIGCGSGYVRNMLARDGYSGSYTGIDMVLEPEYIEKHNSFFSKIIIDDITETKIDQKFDLVISMTVLEHVADDQRAVLVAEEITKVGGVQIHIVPMFPTLFLYFWHGYRQYNKSCLKKLFGSDYNSTEYYRVGGLASFWTHWWWITLPERILGIGSARRKLPQLYKKSLYYSFKIDQFLPFLATAFIIVKKKYK